MSLIKVARRLQAAQVSVQALTRLSSVFVFLAASWSEHSNLALVAVQGTLLGIPYALQEALLGRTLARGVIPRSWNWISWARRASLGTTLVTAPVVVVISMVAVPGAGWQQWAMTCLPVLLQVQVEARFWLLGKLRSTSRGNLVHQIAAAGTMVSATVLALAGHSLLLAAVPAQLLALAWAAGQLRGHAGPGSERPGVYAALRPGLSYSLVTVVNLAFGVALPALAGAYVGEAAVVVLRALELAFGPFHLLLNASVLEDIVRGRLAAVTRPAKLITIVALAGTSGVMIFSEWARALVSDELAATAPMTVAAYCAYKAAVLTTTWQGTRHMLRSTPERFMRTGLVASGIALVAVTAGGGLAHDLHSFLLVLCASEALLITWFAFRNVQDGRLAARGAAPVIPRQAGPDGIKSAETAEVNP